MFSYLITSCSFFFFNSTATTEFYTLSLHDALPIYGQRPCSRWSRRTPAATDRRPPLGGAAAARTWRPRSEEHTSELQSRQYLVCRLLLEKKKKKKTHKRQQQQQHC